ncbi:MAG TPA: oxygenase MpaB family protein, partial [Paenarthrobacter sp.]|nr:oxygenase MpaB family protein [Paenarthrobacter sp.]
GPIPGGPDAYVREWATAGRLIGVHYPPLTEAALHREIEEWHSSGVLRADERLAETVAFIRHPPLSPLLKPGYRILFAAAVESLEPKYREMLGLRTARLGPFPMPAIPAARVALAMVRLALGRRGPSELAARRRLKRLGWPNRLPVRSPLARTVTTNFDAKVPGQAPNSRRVRRDGGQSRWWKYGPETKKPGRSE